jgi:hypothetical protein
MNPTKFEKSYNELQRCVAMFVNTWKYPLDNGRPLPPDDVAEWIKDVMPEFEAALKLAKNTNAQRNGHSAMLKTFIPKDVRKRP